MKPIAQLILFTLSVSPLCGCRGLQSEGQKSRLAAAVPTATVGNNELRLNAELTRVPRAEGFDLVGTIKVSAANGSFPAGISVNHFALRPSWKGFPGYYVMNFTRRHGTWQLPGVYGSDPNFSAASRNEGDHNIIEFTWRNQGRGLGKKPEHFAAYDVSVTVSDADGKRYTLSQLGVPAK